MASSSSKRRKCTAEVFTSFSRSRSSSAMANRRAQSRHLHPAAILDAAQLLELRRGALSASGYSISKVDLPVAAVGDQRVVGRELLGDAFGFEDALGAQHLLHLVLHGSRSSNSHMVFGPTLTWRFFLCAITRARNSGRSRE